MNRHILSILVDNQAGVLNRVCGLFSRRGYNIETLSVGVTEDANISRITVQVDCDDMTIDQIIKQVEKLVDVIRVVELHSDHGVFRELALIKVSAKPQQRSEIASMVDIYRANIIDVASETLTIEITGKPSKIEAFEALMESYGIKEVVRTGLTGLCRGNNPIRKSREEW
ncbi:MAG: acetolactate synthase small subunit [Clostridia bacterium]|nr:acetolactate synthase small subunit [Clostridia bacterium]